MSLSAAPGDPANEAAMGRSRYRRVRSVFEAPILDERKWAKIPQIPADMFFLDLEDSVAPARKDEARERAVSYLREPAYFDGRLTLARPNHLSTPWGCEDVIAFAEAGVTCLAYPKIGSSDELLEVIELLAEHGASPDIYAIIEHSGAMMDLREISRHPQVVSLMFGPGDLSVELGVPLLDDQGRLNPIFAPMKAQTVLAAAAAQIGVTDIVYAPDYRDLDEVRRRAWLARRSGFTALACFYPPHVPIIHEAFTPSKAEIASAQEVVELYEAVLADGKPAALTRDGQTVLVHDYDKALHLLARIG